MKAKFWAFAERHSALVFFGGCLGIGALIELAFYLIGSIPMTQTEADIMLLLLFILLFVLPHWAAELRGKLGDYALFGCAGIAILTLVYFLAVR